MLGLNEWMSQSAKTPQSFLPHFRRSWREVFQREQSSKTTETNNNTNALLKMSQIELDLSILSQSANKTVLITGGARGIGAATASLFNHHGANVVIADLAQFQEATEHLISSTFTNPQRAIFVPGNIVEWAQLTSCFKAAIERFGEIDIVVANAGIMESSPVLDVDSVDEYGDLRENTEAGRVIDVNLKGTLNSMFPV